MFYFGGGYFGLYFPPSIPVPPPVYDTAPLGAFEIPMRIATQVTQPVTVQSQARITMRIVPTVTVPMSRSSSDAIAIPMRVTTLVTLERP